MHINQFGAPGGGPELGAELAAAGAAAEAAGVTYRYPGLLAKIATTLDVVSGGRAWPGIGAAWYDREHEGLGVPFPPLAERIERLEETLRICRQMWDPADNGPFEGRYHRLAETLCAPAPVSRPHPEILIGGGGERKMLRLVARYGDACNLFASSPEEVRHKLDVLRGHCEAEDRDYGTILKTLTCSGDAATEGDLDALLADVDGYTGLGVDTVILVPRLGETSGWLERFVALAVERPAELD